MCNAKIYTSRKDGEGSEDDVEEEHVYLLKLNLFLLFNHCVCVNHKSVLESLSY